MYYIRKEKLLYLHDPLYFLRDKSILLCTMSGCALKTKTVGAEIQCWFEHLGFSCFLFSVMFYIYILTNWFSFLLHAVSALTIASLLAICDGISMQWADQMSEAGGSLPSSLMRNWTAL